MCAYVRSCSCFPVGRRQWGRASPRPPGAAPSPQDLWGPVGHRRAEARRQPHPGERHLRQQPPRPALPPPPALFALRWLEPWQSGHGCCIWLLPFFSSISNQPTFEPLNQGTTHPFKGCRPPPSFSSSPAATSLSCIFVCKFFSISALRPRKQYGSGQCIPAIPPTIHKGSPKIGGFAPPFLCPFLKKNRDFCWESFPS